MIRRSGFVAVALLWAASAKADDTHYQDILVGGRSITLGGAYCALSDDASGLYFNPAGIVDVGYADAQISTSLYGFERGSQSGGPAAPGVPSLDTAFTDLIVIPAAAGFADSVGPRDEKGRARHAYGASIIVPSYRSTSPGAGDQPPVDPNDPSATTTYRHRVTDRSIWAGLGYAYRFNDRLSFGASAFYVLRTVSDSELLTSASGNSSTKTFQTINNDVNFANGAVLANLGVKLRIDDKWTAGANFTTPTAHINSSGNIQYIRATSDPVAGYSDVSGIPLNKLRSNTKGASGLRVGIARSTEFWTVSADVSAHLPIKYRLLNVPSEIAARLPFSVDIDRKAVVNVNVGAEIMPLSWLSLAGGFYTDFSSAHSIGANPTRDQPPQVNLFGGTFAIGYVREHLITRLGALYSAGTGKDVIPNSDLTRLSEGANSFQTTTYAQSFFYVYLSTTFRF